MTATTTKPARTMIWTPNSDEVSPTAGVAELKVHGKSESYLVAEFPTGLTGRAFQLTAIRGGQGYAVVASARGATYDECECEGFKYRGYCKHSAAVRKLLDIGKL